MVLYQMVGNRFFDFAGLNSTGVSVIKFSEN